MINIKPLHELFQKEVDRREFLTHIGGALIAVIGISGFIKKVTDPFNKRPAAPQIKQQVSSYGSSAYGGTKNTA